MDAYLSNRTDLTYSDEHPVLLAATSEAAMAQAERAVAITGLRIGAKLPIEKACERLAQQGRATAVWIEIDRDCGGPMDELLNAVARDAREERYVGVVSTRIDLVDIVSARINEPAVDIIVNPTDAERVAALATVIASFGTPARANDIGTDKNADRLRQLGEEVSRIASTLARLSSGPGSSPVARSETGASNELPPVSAETVRSVIRARRLRARYFSEELFADPAWDMLLDLLQAEIAQLRVPVSSLCIAAAVPATTALRWLKTMVAEGLFIRRADPHDGRRVFVELAPEASQALRRYFGEVGQVAVI
jgi:DNA-binding MarR family transcriptional regulator